MASRWEPVELATLALLVSQGFTTSQIAARMNRTHGSVGSRMKRDSLRAAGNPPVWPDDAVAYLERLHLAGMSSSQMGKVLGKTRNAIIGKLHRLGLNCAADEYARRKAASDKGLAAKRRRALNAERMHLQTSKGGPGSWDARLVEPYAERKLRLAREKALRT